VLLKFKDEQITELKRQL